MAMTKKTKVLIGTGIAAVAAIGGVLLAKKFRSKQVKHESPNPV